VSQNSAAVKEKKSFLSSCGRLNGAFAVRPPSSRKRPGHALPAVRGAPRARRRAGREAPSKIAGRERKKCKRPARKWKGGQILKKVARKTPSLSPSLPFDAQLLPWFSYNRRDREPSRGFRDCNNGLEGKEESRERKGAKEEKDEETLSRERKRKKV